MFVSASRRPRTQPSRKYLKYGTNSDLVLQYYRINVTIEYRNTPKRADGAIFIVLLEQIKSMKSSSNELKIPTENTKSTC